MGSEQSHSGIISHSSGRSTSGKAETVHPARSSSPRPSISSDSDIPYVSYTVNRPIGDKNSMTERVKETWPVLYFPDMPNVPEKIDSPKLPTKSPAHSLRTKTPSPRPSPKAPRPKSYAGSATVHDIVVVKEGAPCMDTLETDSELVKLQNIPTFLPIMRGALNIPTVRDPEVLDKLDHQAILHLCQRYQEHVRHCADAVSSEQNNLASRIREIDFAIATLMSMLTERQKKFAKYAEQLSKVQEISGTLSRCQVSLAEIIESMNMLNSILPPEDRLEPFVMVTG